MRIKHSVLLRLFSLPQHLASDSGPMVGMYVRMVVAIFRMSCQELSDHDNQQFSESS